MNENTPPVDDVVQPFQLESSALRGRLVRLGPALDQILKQHHYQQPIGQLLGEAVVLAAALASSLKYEGVFTLQAKGDAAVRMLVADMTSDGGLRGYAQLADGVSTLGGGAKLLGKGYLAFTVDQTQTEEGKNAERYQGIVELSAPTLSEAVQHYFRQSEQLQSGIIAAVRRDDQGRWRGGCLLLQRMPRATLRQGYGWSGDLRPTELAERRRKGGIVTPHEAALATGDNDDWLRAMMLMETCGANELTHATLPPNDLLFRLFHEEGVRVFEPQPLRHQCRCSEDRVTGMLRSLPREEIESMAVNDVVSVTCEFCNRSYIYDRQRRDTLYGAAT